MQTRKKQWQSGQVVEWPSGQVAGWSSGGAASGKLLVPVLVVLGLLAVAAGVVAWTLPGRSVDYGPTAEARRGPLTISITESGTIHNRDQVEVVNRVEGRTTILWIIDEGEEVEEGDLLVELDASDLEEQLVQREISVQNAEADYIQAREEREVTRSRTESDIAEAELAHRFARLDLAKYMGQATASGSPATEAVTAQVSLEPLGESPNALSDAEAVEQAEGVMGAYQQQLQRLESEITIAEEDLQRAEDTYEWSQRLAEAGYITQMELRADQLSYMRAQISLNLARSELEVFENYTHQRELAQLQSDVEQTAQALERTRLSANSDMVQAAARYNAREAELERERRRLERTKEQLEATRLYAPVPGMVVYATTGQGGWRGNQEPLQEGQEVREREDLIYLPRSEGMMAEVKVHESTLNRIERDMPARVTVDARPGQVYHGRVSRIGLMPDAQSVWLNPDLTVYNTEIEIDATDLRAGMSARAEILIEQLDDVVYVPIQSIVRYEGRHFAYVVTPRGPQPRRVEIGLDNNRMVHVKSGLEPGEHVLLAPPLPTEMEDDEEEEELMDEQPPGPADPTRPGNV